MKLRDYIELSKRSLKIRKKSNRSTIIALSLGFTLLIPVLVCLFGVNVSLNDQLNENPYLLYMNAAMSDYRIATEDYIDNESVNLSGSNHIDYITSGKNITRAIIYEQYLLRTESYTATEFRLSVNGEERNLAEKKYSSFSIIDLDKSDSIFPKNLVDYYPGGIFLKGYDKGFEGVGKKQVVVSESFLRGNNLTAESVYLKELTISASEKLYTGKDNGEQINGNICTGYTVVGIIKSEITEIYRANELMSSDLFFTSANVYDDQGRAMLKPRYVKDGENTYDRYIKYDNIADKERLNAEYMMLGWNQIGSILSKRFNLETYGDTLVYGESDSYSGLARSIKGLNAEFIAAARQESEYVSGSQVFDKFRIIYNVTNIVSIIFLVISSVLAVSALINMYCSISHNVSERAEYLTMMRAIGAKDRTIPKLYMIESAILSGISGGIIAVLGFIISTAVKLGLDSALKNYKLSIPWLTIIVTVIAAAAIVIALSLIFSYISTVKLSRRKITDILNS